MGQKASQEAKIAPSTTAWPPLVQPPMPAIARKVTEKKLNKYMQSDWNEPTNQPPSQLNSQTTWI